LVEVGLASGETLLGRLKKGRHAYVIEQSPANPDQESTLVAIASGGDIVSVRTVSAMITFSSMAVFRNSSGLSA
jgi:hypothetical protein